MIQRKELLKYLGYKGQEINKELEDKISQAILLCEKTIKPRHVIKKFNLNKENNVVEGTTLMLEGRSILKHIEGCSKIYMIAATLGADFDKIIKKEFTKDKTMAVILDSAATCAIEDYLDSIEETIEKNHTSRFSCGYGDFDIKKQKLICDILDTNRKIGLYVTSSFMLTPQKSVTAIIGVKDEN